MRALALLLVLTLAGCVAQAPSPATNNTTSTTPAAPAALPPPIHDSKQVQGGAEPLAGAVGPPCSTPGAKCFSYPFQLNASAHVVATLTWTLPASDFDLYVFQGAKQVQASANPPPGTQEKIDTKLDAGAYTVTVSAASVSQDTFDLKVTFDQAG
jgi:hypothetical protein